jgi:hypothetical protein
LKHRVGHTAAADYKLIPTLQSTQPKQATKRNNTMKSRIITFLLLVQVMCLCVESQAWPQPDLFLGTVLSCDTQEIQEQQFCDVIHKKGYNRAKNLIPDSVEGWNNTAGALDSAAESFVSMVKVVNQRDVDTKGAKPKYDMMNLACSGALRNLLCAKFFMKCTSVQDYDLPCMSSCQSVKSNCAGQPLSVYAKTFVNGLNCKDTSMYSMEPCTSSSSSIRVNQLIGYFITTMLALLVIM